jgi:hypothetical protein
MSKKGKFGIAVVVWLIFNWGWAYKDGVFNRMYVVYKMSKGENFSFTPSETWTYIMDGILPEVKVEPVDEGFTPSGESLLYGRCDECGAPCTPLGCLADPFHTIAQN